ncbi:glucosamine-6-phosphate deaminase [Gulosibacter chungangensis]|uniref:Glucosamine-6-phosphate deaminase n=1 Tax=Gulosibacter chungangensis TaxID=979746 RepID=A0A7J5BAB9_9MICO|nr:glucosamine-6-phosphate deaminase [Gulosibacter chungangensis]KAB1642709.1 glucosamine-6-phosphate deaminase [Gulosibacter chungangensis]
MDVIIAREINQIAQTIADEIEQLLRDKPTAVLGLATGSSPLAVYDELARRYEAGRISFANARAFMLDEYVGLPADHPERYFNVIMRDFVSKVDFAADAVRGPDGLTDDPQAAAIEYDKAIAAAGGIDLQILGVGSNGHIAFNEPGSAKDSRTRMLGLTAQTRRDNSRFFDNVVDAVPTHCVSQGLGTILEARRIYLIALGKAKAAAIHQLVEGQVSVDWPVTLLHEHSKVSVLLDDEAASLLSATVA